MVLGFKTTINGKPTGFPEKILAGTKIHSMRTGYRWKAGMKIHPATGVRTKHYKQITPDPLDCISTQLIEIWHLSQKEKVINIDGFEYNTLNDHFYTFFPALAINDGFDSVDDFFAWFNEDFTGQIIHWTDYQY